MRNYNMPDRKVRIIKTRAHYANEVSARVAVIKRKYILCIKGAKSAMKIKSKRIKISHLRDCECVCVSVCSLCYCTHYVIYNKKKHNVRVRVHAAY